MYGRHGHDDDIITVWHRDVDDTLSSMKLGEQFAHRVIRQSRYYHMLTLSVRVRQLVPEVSMAKQAKGRTSYRQAFARSSVHVATSAHALPTAPLVSSPQDPIPGQHR